MNPETAAILVEVAKAFVIAGFTQLRMAGMKDDEILKYAADVHALFMSLPPATNLPEVPK